MRVLGVLDLLDGRAVHARGGTRTRYEPVRAVDGAAIEPGSALELARAYVDRFGLADLYAADLDAIMGRSWQGRLVAELAAFGALWLDAGVSSVDAAQRALALGASRVIVGLETLGSWEALREICAAAERERVAFSLDLRDGEPLAHAGITRREPAPVVASRAADSGVQSIVVIDLAKVGAGSGLDLALIEGVRAATPRVTLLAGGGVRGLDDIRRLADAGCDGVLVASALHDGRLGAADVTVARRLDRSGGLSAPRTLA